MDVDRTVHMVEVADSLAVFVVGLLIGAFGIYVGGRIVVDVADYGHAVVTAVIGSLVWAIASFVFGGLPFVGPILAFVAYLGVIYWRYPGGWGDALKISLVAWIVVAIVLYALVSLGLTSPGAVGVPTV